MVVLLIISTLSRNQYFSCYTDYETDYGNDYCFANYTRPQNFFLKDFSQFCHPQESVHVYILQISERFPLSLDCHNSKYFKVYILLVFVCTFVYALSKFVSCFLLVYQKNNDYGPRLFPSKTVMLPSPSD